MSGPDAGFVLPNGARRSPDVSWVSRDRQRELGPVGRARFLHGVPEFIVEVRSHSDRLLTLRRKMREWIDNGAELGWLIDPERRTVEVYRPGKEAEEFISPTVLAAGSPVEGFILDLGPVWEPTAS